MPAPTPKPSAELVSKIVNFNSEEKTKEVNLSIISNDAALVNPLKPSNRDSAKNSNNYFIIPTTGWNWGQLHYYNAIDIANVCGIPVYAAADGFIIESAVNGWNSGYGQYIKIEHPNNTKTVYAHLGENSATVGKFVNQGDLIGYIGNTGTTHGPTGCHLHFEVWGDKNPLAK